MRRLIVYPSKMGSMGARALKNALGTILVRPDGRYRPKPQDSIINWGASRVPNWFRGKDGLNGERHTVVCNMFDPVACAIRKDLTFAMLQQFKVPTVGWTQAKGEAKRWIGMGATVFARKIMSGTKGHGIVIMKTPEEFVDAPLYTKYEKGCKEYRVHVVSGQVIDFQQKKKRKGVEVDKLIRNHDNGWVFARSDVVLPEGVGDTCVKAIEALGLTFGGVDVLHRAKTGEIYVLEINTAPGLKGTTLQRYVEAFKELIK